MFDTKEHNYRKLETLIITRLTPILISLASQFTFHFDYQRHLMFCLYMIKANFYALNPIKFKTKKCISKLELATKISRVG